MVHHETKDQTVAKGKDNAPALPADWLPSLDDESTDDSMRSVEQNRGRQGGAELHPDDAE